MKNISFIKTFKWCTFSLFLLLNITSCNKEKEETELALMFSYIDDNNIKGDSLPSGLFYSETGFSTPDTYDSDLPKKGDTVLTIYKAYFLDETGDLSLFDETSFVEPGKYVFKEDPVILGWEESIGLMHKDVSALVIMPSKLAYGGDQVGNIPPYSPLIFDIRIIDIISPSK